MFDEMKKSMQSVSSQQYKFSIKINKVMIAIAVILLIPFSIYMFCLPMWWVGFIPLFVLAVFCLIGFKVIRWMNDKYQEALLREKQQQKKTAEIQNKITELQNKIDELQQEEKNNQH